MANLKVIHVHLKGLRKDYYFGSVVAIFQHLTRDQVGCGYNYLRRAGLSGGGTVTTSKAIIKQSVLLTAQRASSDESPTTPN